MNFNWKKLILLSTFLVVFNFFPNYTFAQDGTISTPGVITGSGSSQTIPDSILSDSWFLQNIFTPLKTITDSLASTPLSQLNSNDYNQAINATNNIIKKLTDKISSGQLKPDESAAYSQIISGLNSNITDWTQKRDDRIRLENQYRDQSQVTKSNSDSSSKTYTCQLFPYPSLRGCMLLGFQYLLSIILWLTAWILYLASWIFNESVKISVLQFSDYANGSALPGIEVAWKLARDLANIFFIFILLYVAIKTVLGEGGAQKLVANVIIMALLVNFSAVIPRVVIDASNILALQFYNSIGKEMDGGGRDISSSIINWDTRSQYFTSGEFNGQTSDTEPLGLSDTIVKSIGTFFLMLTLAFVLVAAAVLFIYRTIVLLVVIMLSPLAIMGWALPKYGSYSNKWLDTLTKEAIWAPAFLFMLYMILKIFEDTNRSTQGYGQIILFILMNGMLMAAIGIASSFSTKGADTANKLGNKFKGFFTGAAAGVAGSAGVYGFGRTAQKVMDKDWVKNLKKSTTGRLFNDFVLDKTLGRVAGSKYGTSQTYKERIEKEAGRITQFKGAADQAQYLSSLGGVDRAAAWGKLSDRQKAEVLHHIDEVEAGTATTNLSAAKEQKMILDIKGDGTDKNKGLAPKTGTDAWDKLQDEKDRVKTSQDVKKAREELDKVGTGQHPTMVQIKSSVDLLKGNSINRVDLDKVLHPDVISNLNGQQLKTLAKHSEFNPNTAVTTATSTNPNIIAPVGSTVRRVIEETAADSLGLPVGTRLNPAQINSLTGNLKSAYKYLSSPDGVMNYI